MANTSSLQRQRRLFRRFIVVSILLHILLVSAFFLPDYLRKLKLLHPAASAPQTAYEKAQKHHEAQTRAAEEAKKQESAKAAEEVKQEIAGELHDEFKAVVGDQLPPQDAQEVWANLLAQLTAGLDGYSQQVADAGDIDLQQGMTDLQARMLEELAAQLRAKSRKDLADSFVASVKSDVAPKLLEFYRHQLELKIGNALRDEGAKIVKDDAADIREKRRVATAALADASKSAAAAIADLTSAKRKLDAADKLADTYRAAGKADKADAKMADTVHEAQATMESAGKSVQSAGEKLKEAADRAEVLSPQTTQAIRAAQDDIARATKDVAKAGEDAKAGIPADFAKSDGKAADTASQLADAIKLAKENLYRESNAGDISVEARTAMKHARDEDIKQLIEKAFWENYANKSAPRLGDKLAGAFKKTLEENGIKDDAVVAEVDKRVKDVLLDDVKDKINAGQAGTDPLSKALKLDDINDALPDGADGSHHHHEATTHHHHKADGTGAAGQDVADAADANGAATQNAADDNAAAAAREKAIADRIGKTARDLVHSGIEGIGDDVSNDDAAVRAAHAAAPAKHAKGDEDGDGDGLAGLAARVGRLAGNVKEGRTDLADAAAAGNGGAGTPGAGAAGVGAAGFGIPHRVFGPERFHGLQLHNHPHGTDEAEYAKLTGDIKNREAGSARGQATTRQSADGRMTAVSNEPDASASPRPAVVLVPADSKTEAVGQPQNAAPYVPKFKSIRFAAIPYRSKPVTIDGDLSEWKDVPELAMTPSQEFGTTLPPGIKVFPQAVKVQWDNTGFYLAYDVKDADGKIRKVKPGDFWEGDGIEFWVDTLNTKEKSRTVCTHQFWAWVDGAADNPAQVGGEAQSWPGKDDYVPLGADVIKTASKKTDAGWTIEVFVPASRFRMLDLQPGRILGMNFSICTGTELYYYWAGTTKIATARRPDTWGDVLLAGSAGRLECVDKLASELSASETSKTLNAVRIGQPLRVRVSDADMNLSDAVKDRVAVTVSTRRGAKQTLILEETGNATGIFEGAIPTTLDTGTAPPGVLPLLDGDKIDLVYIDQCRPDGSRDVPVKLTLPTAASITKLGEK